jgi:hypothetical protein
MRQKKVIGILLLLALLTACATLKVRNPEGFAVAVSSSLLGGRNIFEALSPEGMLYRVRTVENYPPQGVAFWADALRNHLEEEGYTQVLETEAFEAGEREGVLFEWILPYGSEDYIYLTAIVISDEKIAIAEAAGEHTVYLHYRDALKESLKTIRF